MNEGGTKPNTYWFECSPNSPINAQVQKNNENKVHRRIVFFKCISWTHVLSITEIVLFIRGISWCPIYTPLGTAGHINKGIVIPGWTQTNHHCFLPNHLNTGEMGWNKQNVDHRYTCYTCYTCYTSSWPPATSWAHTTNLTRLLHDVVADFEQYFAGVCPYQLPK